MCSHEQTLNFKQGGDNGSDSGSDSGSPAVSCFQQVVLDCL